MISHYIARQLIAKDGTPVSEQACLAKPGTIVVLAEPGAGKTELLDSFGRALGVTPQRASIFRHKSHITPGHALVIDALDEVARQDLSALDGLIVKALDLKANTTVLASRASEWSQERNHFIKDCTGRAPTVVHLQPFNTAEQQQLFETLFPGEDFKAFHTQADRFGFAPILGNPMFLRFVVEGYIQAGRQIHSKQQIFKDAVDRLGSDDGKSQGPAPRPPIDVIVSSASAIFAKLLLSGAVGVANTERPRDREFPYIASLTEEASTVWKGILNSRLFKPAADADDHEPVHRIVAEYCAAGYLARRIVDPADTLSLKRCLAIIAPNAVPRDDLRGLLGWLAALGHQPVQDAIIALDPYAVLANGDPAQLTTLSKRRLIAQLRSLSKADPLFRRTDAWRRFNAAGFLTADLVDDLRPIITTPDDGSHLLDLVLELLPDSSAAAVLETELRTLMLDRTADLTARRLTPMPKESSNDWKRQSMPASFRRLPTPSNSRAFSSSRHWPRPVRHPICGGSRASKRSSPSKPNLLPNGLRPTRTLCSRRCARSLISPLPTPIALGSSHSSNVAATTASPTHAAPKHPSKLRFAISGSCATSSSLTPIAPASGPTCCPIRTASSSCRSIWAGCTATAPALGRHSMPQRSTGFSTHMSARGRAPRRREPSVREDLTQIIVD